MSSSGFKVPSLWSAANTHCHVENLHVINEAKLVVVRQQEETEGYTGCQLTLRAFAWQQAQELIVIPGLLGCVYAIINLGTCLFAWD